MARIIGSDSSAARERRSLMRSCAEILRLLAQRPVFDDEARDMAAYLVFCLRNIYQTIDESARAWDDRNYWKKAEGLREKWRWSRTAADQLEALVLAGRWQDEALPTLLLSLVPHFSDITVASITREADWWCGALRALKKQAS
jgi:hypothetical protein